jgi:hypothetical protein
MKGLIKSWIRDPSRIYKFDKCVKGPRLDPLPAGHDDLPVFWPHGTHGGNGGRAHSRPRQRHARPPGSETPPRAWRAPWMDRQSFQSGPDRLCAVRGARAPLLASFYTRGCDRAEAPRAGRLERASTNASRCRWALPRAVPSVPESDALGADRNRSQRDGPANLNGRAEAPCTGVCSAGSTPDHADGWRPSRHE